MNRLVNFFAIALICFSVSANAGLARVIVPTSEAYKTIYLGQITPNLQKVVKDLVSVMDQTLRTEVRSGETLIVQPYNQRVPSGTYTYEKALRLSFEEQYLLQLSLRVLVPSARVYYEMDSWKDILYTNVLVIIP
jgi:hypothetical protein